MSGYDAFALYYDTLTKNVDYAGRADYLLSVLKRLNHFAGITLDLACGTGSLTLALYARGVDVYGADASIPMLSVAKEKAAQQGAENVLFLCQKMQSLDLFGTVNTVFCCLDSINHVNSLKDMEQVFRRVSLFLESGGYFVFDFNTIYKHQTVLKDKVFVYDIDPVFCVWTNKLRPNTNRVDISLDFFERTGTSYHRSSERFSEITCTLAQVSQMLGAVGLGELQFFEDLTFDPPTPQSQRVVVVARKPIDEGGVHHGSDDTLHHP